MVSVVMSLLSMTTIEEPDPNRVKQLEKIIEEHKESIEDLRNSISREKIQETLEELKDEKIKEIEEQKRLEEKLRREEAKRREAEAKERARFTQTVKYTNFYVGDSTGSGAGTSVGLSTRDFGVNEKGWYTYNGKVVIATATNLCLEIQSGPCARYNSLPAGFNAYNLWDELDIVVDGRKYEAVVLSSCGACFWNEKHQRVDIFVSNSGKFGTKIGEVDVRVKNR